MAIDQTKYVRYADEYDRFSKAAGLPTQQERLYQNGFGPKQAKAAERTNEEYNRLLNHIKSVGIDLMGFDEHVMPISVLTEMDKAYSLMAEKYPKEIQGLSIRYGISKDKDTFGWYDPKEKEIVFNRAVFSAPNQMVQSYVRSVSYNQFPKNTDWKALFYHEFGHRFSDVNHVDNLSAVKVMEQKLGYGYHTSKRADAMLTKYLSEYSTEKTKPQYQEVIAECFGECYNSKEPREFCIEYLKEVGAI